MRTISDRGPDRETPETTSRFGAHLPFRRPAGKNDVKRHSIEKHSYDLNNIYNATFPLFDYDFTQVAEPNPKEQLGKVATGHNEPLMKLHLRHYYLIIAIRPQREMPKTKQPSPSRAKSSRRR